MNEFFCLSSFIDLKRLFPLSPPPPTTPSDFLCFFVSPLSSPQSPTIWRTEYLYVRVWMDFQGVLKVRVIKGTDLAIRDLFRSDPYVKLLIAEHVSFLFFSFFFEIHGLFLHMCIFALHKFLLDIICTISVHAIFTQVLCMLNLHDIYWMLFCCTISMYIFIVCKNFMLCYFFHNLCWLL